MCGGEGVGSYFLLALKTLAALCSALCLLKSSSG